MKKIIFRIFILTFTLLMGMTTYAPQDALAMNRVKQWVNKVKPGTFPELEQADASSDAKAKEKKFTPDDYKVLTALTQKEESLNQRSKRIQLREKELRALEQRVERKLNQMRDLAVKIESEREERKTMDEKDISRMVKYYESMDPENTSVFLNQMDRITAAHILMRMNPRKASGVMQLLDPNVAVEITEMVTRFKENRSKSLD